MLGNSTFLHFPYDLERGEYTLLICESLLGILLFWGQMAVTVM